MLYVQSDGAIRLTRGDTARFTVSITNDVTNDVYEIQEGDTLTMSVKKSINDEYPILQKKVIGTNAFYIEPTDTQSFSFGTYKYDVQLTTAGGDVYTVIEPSSFEIMKEVTF